MTNDPHRDEPQSVYQAWQRANSPERREQRGAGVMAVVLGCVVLAVLAVIPTVGPILAVAGIITIFWWQPRLRQALLKGRQD